MVGYTRVAPLVIATLVVGALSTLVRAQGSTPTPIGAWFGIARPCTSGSRFQPPPGTVDQNICREACLGACPQSNFPVDEVTMIPTILADGTVLADDFAELLDHHSTAQGKWEYAGAAVIGGQRFDRYQASFIWFQARGPQDLVPNSAPTAIFQGVVRPRFVTFFNPLDPDIMKGYIQPYLYTMTDSSGIVQMQPGSPFPATDPLARLPVTCDPTARTNPYCLGTLTFTIRRIQAH